jgi:hypothetical protein
MIMMALLTPTPPSFVSLLVRRNEAIGLIAFSSLSSLRLSSGVLTPLTNPIMSGSTKRMSADEKRKAILDIYHKTKTVFTEKEIVTLATKAGVNSNTCVSLV